MKVFNPGAREELQSEIARMFYRRGLPFRFARNPRYVKAFTMTANSNLSGFLPPGYNALRTSLLRKEKANAERVLQLIRGTWSEKGVTIVTDGSSDSQ